MKVDLVDLIKRPRHEGSSRVPQPKKANRFAPRAQLDELAGASVRTRHAVLLADPRSGAHRGRLALQPLPCAISELEMLCPWLVYSAASFFPPPPSRT